MQNSLVFRDGSLKVVWNVRLVCIESIGILILLIVNVHFNIWKNWMHYVVHIGNSSDFFFVVCSCFSKYNRLIFVLLFLFLTLVWIVTTSFDKFELQCQKSLSLVNGVVPIRLKFELYAGFVKWGSWINFLFMRGQDIVNTWDFSSKISRHCHKRLVPKIVVWHDQRELFPKMPLRERLVCLVNFIGVILLCLQPLRRCFLRVCFPTLFAAVLKDFLPLTTSPISGAAKSDMSAPMRFAVGTTSLRKKGIAVLALTCARALEPVPLCLLTPLMYGVSTCLETTIS